MKNQRKTEIKVGITVLIGIIVMLLILGWAKNFSFFVEQKKITVNFNNSAGLEVGDPISFNGVRKGYVDNIELKNKGVLVTGIIDNDALLYDDAKFSIMMLDLMGGKKIEVNPGVSNKEIDYSIIHSGKFEGDISSVMAAFNGVQTDLVATIQDLRITLSAANKILTDNKFKEDVNLIVSGLNSLTLNLNDLIESNSSVITEVLDNSKSITNDLQSLITNNSENVTKLVNKSVITITETEKLVVSLQSIIDEMTNKKNNAGELLYDKDILRDIKSSMEQVRELTKLLIDQLKGEGLNVDANLNIF